MSTWLTRIAINSALMVIRRRRHPYAEVSFTPPSESSAGFQEFDILDSALTPEEICDLKQRFDRMRSAVDRLDPKSRTAIGIWSTQECTMKELAHALDVSLATVKARLHRARKRLARGEASTTSTKGLFPRSTGISNSDPHRDMPETLLNRLPESVCVQQSRNGGALSAPASELRNFIDWVARLVRRPVSTRILTEIWLDELTCMDCTPEPISKGWRIVSLRASTSLANSLIASQLRDP